MSIPRSAWDRLLAWLIDWLCILGWVLVTAAPGVPLYLVGVIRTSHPFVENAVAALVLVVPVTVTLAVMESGTRAASVGKRVRGLRVADVDTGPPPSFPRSLLRTGLKVALPWLLAHVAVYGIVATSDASVPGWLWVLTAASYALPIIWTVSLFVGSGRTPYDVASRTVVISSGRR